MTDEATPETAELETEEVPAEHVEEVEERVQEAYRITGHPGPAAGIIARVNYVQQLIDYVGKTGTSGDGYQFRTIDGVLKALHNPLGEAGVVVLPNVTEHYEREWEGYKLWGTLSGKLDKYAESQEGINAQMASGELIKMANPNRLVRLTVDYQLWCEPDTRQWESAGLLGSKVNSNEARMPMVRFTAVGEGIDNSDKAVGKAMSYAYKAAMSQVFSIPTEQPEMDNEHADQKAQQGGVSTQEPWWRTAGWQSEKQAMETRKSLLDQVRAFPEQTQDHVKKWMDAFTMEDGSWQGASLMRDAKKKSVAGVFSFSDAQQLQDKIDDLISVAELEAAGEEPFPTTGDETPAESEPTPDGQLPLPQETDRHDLMRAALQSNTEEGLTVTAAAEMTELSRAEAQSTLDSLANDGEVTVTKVGRSNVYTLDQTGDPDPGTAPTE